MQESLYIYPVGAFGSFPWVTEASRRSPGPRYLQGGTGALPEDDDLGRRCRWCCFRSCCSSPPTRDDSEDDLRSLYWYYTCHGWWALAVRAAMEIALWATATVVLSYMSYFSWLRVRWHWQHYLVWNATIVCTFVWWMTSYAWYKALTTAAYCRRLCRDELELRDEYMNVGTWQDLVTTYLLWRNRELNALADGGSHSHGHGHTSASASSSSSWDQQKGRSTPLLLSIPPSSSRTLAAATARVSQISPGELIKIAVRLNAADNLLRDWLWRAERGDMQDVFGLQGGAAGWMLSPWVLINLRWALLQPIAQRLAGQGGGALVQDGDDSGRVVMLNEEEAQDVLVRLVTRRLRTAALLNLLFLPLILLYTLLHFMFRHAIQLYVTRDIFGPRGWTPYAFLTLATQEELPHEVAGRLDGLRKIADLFLDTYPSHATTQALRGLTLVFGAAASCLFLAAVVNTDDDSDWTSEGIASLYAGSGLCASATLVCGAACPTVSGLQPLQSLKLETLMATVTNVVDRSPPGAVAAKSARRKTTPSYTGPDAQDLGDKEDEDDAGKHQVINDMTGSYSVSEEDAARPATRGAATGNIPAAVHLQRTLTGLYKFRSLLFFDEIRALLACPLWLGCSLASESPELVRSVFSGQESA